MRHYAELVEQLGAVRRGDGVLPGSLNDLAARFYKSGPFQQLKPRTQAEYKSYIERVRKKNGDKMVRSLTRVEVISMHESLSEHPTTANAFLKAMHVLLEFAKNRGFVEINVSDNIPRLKKTRHGRNGWKRWPQTQIDKAKAVLTGDARLAFLLAVYTGQRFGDIWKMTGADINDNGKLVVVQDKTEKELKIPIHPALAKELPNTDGRYFPQSFQGFKTMWRRAKAKHGLTHPFHGLRKNAVTSLLEVECSIAQTGAITGQTYETVELYAREVDQERLAEDAMKKWIGKPDWKTSAENSDEKA